MLEFSSEGREMAKTSRLLKLCILNIKIESNTTTGTERERYSKLMEALYNAKVPVKLRGDRYCMMRLMFNNEGVTHEKHGMLVAFTTVNSDDYFNMATLNIETGLTFDRSKCLNPKDIPFFFFSDHHRIFIPADGDISINSVIKYFEKALNKIVKPDEIVHVIPEQSKVGFDKIKAAHDISKITIHITPTNSDDVALALARKMDASYKEAGVGEVNSEYRPRKGKKHNTIGDSDFINAEMFLARENGWVEADIINSMGKREKIATRESPLILKLLHHDNFEDVDLVKEYIHNRYDEEK